VKRIYINPNRALAPQLQPAVDAIAAGQVVAFPTDTLYGLGANPFDPAGVAGELGVARIDDGANLVASLLEEGHDHAQRRALEDEQRRHIDKLDVPVLDLPRLADGIDLGGLYELAAELCEQGVG